MDKIPDAQITQALDIFQQIAESNRQIVYAVSEKVLHCNYNFLPKTNLPQSPFSPQTPPPKHFQHSRNPQNPCSDNVHQPTSPPTPQVCCSPAGPTNPTARSKDGRDDPAFAAVRSRSQIAPSDQVFHVADIFSQNSSSANDPSYADSPRPAAESWPQLGKKHGSPERPLHQSEQPVSYTARHTALTDEHNGLRSLSQNLTGDQVFHAADEKSHAPERPLQRSTRPLYSTALPTALADDHCMNAAAPQVSSNNPKEQSSSDDDMPHLLSSSSSSEDSGNESEAQGLTPLSGKFWNSSEGSDSDHSDKTNHKVTSEHQYWTCGDSTLYDTPLQQEMLMNPNEESQLRTPSTIPCTDGVPAEHDTAVRDEKDDDAFRFSASTPHTKHYRPRANRRDNRRAARRLLLHQEEVEDLLLTEATVRNEIYTQAIEQCASTFKAIIELQETCLRHTIKAESLDPFTLFYHLIEANALLRFWLHEEQQCTFRSLVCEAWVAEHQYINGKLYASYIKLLLTTLEDFESTVRGELEHQASEKMINQEPQPPSWADQTDQEEDFWNSRPVHHTSVAFEAIFSISQRFICCFPEPTINPDPYLSVCVQAALHAEELTRYKLAVIETQAFLHVLISDEARACADHLALLATTAISYDKQLWESFELSVDLLTSWCP